MFYIFSGSQFSWLSFVSYNTISSRDNKISFWLPPLRVLAFVTFPTCLWSLHTSGAYIPLEPTYLWSLHVSGAYIPLVPTYLWNLHTSETYIPLEPSGTYIPLEPTYLRESPASGAYILSGAAYMPLEPTYLRNLHASGSRLPLKPTYSQEPTCLRESPASGAYILSGAYLPLEPLYYSPSPCCPLISLFISDPLVFQVIQSLHFFFIQRLPCFLPLWTTL